MSNTCHGVGFSELVKCYESDGYYNAHGWTQSTGRGGGFPYKPPAGWEFDPGFSDKRDPRLGTHGGCSNCIMVLVHLRKPIMPPDTPVDEPETDEPVDESETDTPTDIDIPTTLPGDGYEPSTSDGMSKLDIKPIHLIVIAVLIFLFFMLRK
jgi:hypothetical protein